MLAATPWDALKDLAETLEREKEVIVKRHFTYNKGNGCWESEDVELSKWVTDREELIERILDRAAEYTVEV